VWILDLFQAVQAIQPTVEVKLGRKTKTWSQRIMRAIMESSGPCTKKRDVGRRLSMDKISYTIIGSELYFSFKYIVYVFT